MISVAILSVIQNGTMAHKSGGKFTRFKPTARADLQESQAPLSLAVFADTDASVLKPIFLYNHISAAIGTGFASGECLTDDMDK
jgi:hypothetical protein